MTIRRQVSEIAKKSTNPGLRRGYLADDWDGISTTVQVILSRGSSSAVQAFIAAGAFGTEQVYPAGTSLFLLEAKGQLEVVSLGSKLTAGAVTGPMMSSEFEFPDVYGAPGFTPDGFVGSWDDYVALGVANALFADGIDEELPIGQSTILPYWKLHKLEGNPTATRMADSAAPSGHKIRFQFTAANQRAFLESDPIPCYGGVSYATAVVWGWNKTMSASWNLGMRIQWLDVNKQFISSTASFAGPGIDDTGVQALFYFGFDTVSFPAPLTARFMRIQLEVREYATHDTGDHYIDIGLIRVGAAPTALEKTGNYWIDNLIIGQADGYGYLQVGYGDVIFEANGDGSFGVFDSVTPDNNFTVDGSAGITGEVTAYPEHSDTAFAITNDGTATYSGKSCNWVKIGSLVVFRIAWTLSGNGSGTGALSIDSEDFALPKARSGFTVIGDRGGVGVQRILMRAVNGTNYLTFTQISTISAPTTYLTGADLLNNAVYSFHGTYIAA